MDDIRLDLNNEKIQSDKNAHTEWRRQETDEVKIIRVAGISGYWAFVVSCLHVILAVVLINKILTDIERQ